MPADRAIRVYSPNHVVRKLETYSENNQIALVPCLKQNSDYYWLQLKVKGMYLSTTKLQDVHTGSLNPNAT